MVGPDWVQQRPNATMGRMLSHPPHRMLLGMIAYWTVMAAFMFIAECGVQM